MPVQGNSRMVNKHNGCVSVMNLFADVRLCFDQNNGLKSMWAERAVSCLKEELCNVGRFSCCVMCLRPSADCQRE